MTLAARATLVALTALAACGGTDPQPTPDAGGTATPDAGGASTASGGAWVLSNVVNSTLSQHDAKGALLQSVDVSAKLQTGRLYLFRYDPTGPAFWVGNNAGDFYRFDKDFNVTAQVKALGAVRNNYAIDLAGDGGLFVGLQAGKVVKLDKAGATVLQSAADYAGLEYLEVDPKDQSVWLTYRVGYKDRIGKLDAALALVGYVEASDTAGCEYPYSMAVSPVDQAVWLLCGCYHCIGVNPNSLMHLSASVQDLGAFSMHDTGGSAYYLTYADRDGNLWVNNRKDANFLKMSPQGQTLATVALDGVYTFASLADGSGHWAVGAYNDNTKVRKLDPAGVEVLSFHAPAGVEVVQAIP